MRKIFIQKIFVFLMEDQLTFGIISLTTQIYKSMVHFKFKLCVLLSIYCFSLDAQTYSKSNVDYINPFIGTGGHGHTYPGATMPFGMIQLSPDTRLTGWDGCSGYHYTDEIVYGFSHTHLSGTGVSDYGDILLMPTVGEIRLNNGANGEPGYRSSFSKNKEIAKAGYYSCYLDDYNIKVELTANKRSAMHKYTFEDDKTVSNLIIDLAHRDKLIDSHFEIVNENEVQGYRISDAWAKEQYVYFVAQFSRPIINLNPASDDLDQVFALEFGPSKERDLLVRIGISAVSMEGAKKNLEEEIKDFDFEKLKNKAQESWKKACAKIEIEDSNEANKEIFYSALYHTMIVPNLFQDVDGRYRGMDLNIHKSSNHTNYTIFSLWDTYRATHPLYTILEQDRTNDFIKTFLDQHDKGGILPIWELAGNYTGCMIGYHSIPVITDAYVKGIRDYDSNKALAAMVNSANQDHLGLQSYKTHGYIFSDEEAESVSKTLEYAYDDWCIAQLAKSLGYKDIYNNFIQRAQNYKNIFDPQTGFMRAKRNNTWVEPFQPEEVNFHFTEANSWQYSFYVPQDVSGFIDLLGGKKQLDTKLDQLFTTSSETSGREQVDITGLIGQYAHGNEPSHHMAYLYNYIGKPWKTQQRVREIMLDLYSNQPDGLSGNEDCGQMSAWYIFSALGFYPVTPGSDEYAIGSPLFESVKINLENGNSFIIKSKNNTAKNTYVQSMVLNGKPYTKSYIKHQDIMEGGELLFEMGPEPSKNFGIKDEDIIQSTIEEQLIMPLPYVQSGRTAFMDTERIMLGHVDPEVNIYYSINGELPNKNSEIFKEEITIDKTTTIQFFAGKKGLPDSKIMEASFYKIPAKRNIKLGTQYASQYAAGGDDGLINFIRGTKDFRTGAWQGYEGIPLEATIDLGKVKAIKSVALGCLQDQNSWIFMPEAVTISISRNGKKFKQYAHILNDISPKQDGAILKEFKTAIDAKARYVKVEAVNRAVVPDWHKGAGGKSWIFVDEIVIE